MREYLPVLVFLVLGLGIGLLFTNANRLLGPSRPSRIKQEPYESGLPSRFGPGMRFGVSFYLVGMLFIIFDIEIILLYPAAIVLGDSVFALVAISIFIFFLGVAFVYEWRRGSLNWTEE